MVHSCLEVHANACFIMAATQAAALLRQLQSHLSVALLPQLAASHAGTRDLLHQILQRSFILLHIRWTSRCMLESLVK